MDNKHWYYLHSVTKDLIHKRTEPESDSSFVLKVWKCDTRDRLDAWTIVTEALALGAKKERIDELVKLWELTNEDAQIFAEKTNRKVFQDGDSWCATYHDFIDLASSPCEFGDTALEALAELERKGGS
jgi:hypothetical protein